MKDLFKKKLFLEVYFPLAIPVFPFMMVLIKAILGVEIDLFFILVLSVLAVILGRYIIINRKRSNDSTMNTTEETATFKGF